LVLEVDIHIRVCKLRNKYGIGTDSGPVWPTFYMLFSGS